MPVRLTEARAAIQRLRGMQAGEYVQKIVGVHAFTDHMSKEAAISAASSQKIQKGYYEYIETKQINNVPEFNALNDKHKRRLFNGQTPYLRKKPSQLGQLLGGKELTRTVSLTDNHMLLLIKQTINASANEQQCQYRQGGLEGRFLFFAPVPQQFVARAIDVSLVKQGGGGHGNRGLPWSVLVIACGQYPNLISPIVISAYPADNTYFQSKKPLDSN